jgi:two-component system, cell cycle sensor histidine kinase and response regulator CckA
MKVWRVLLVDDEPSVARAISRLLMSLGHQVLVELDPTSAMQRLRDDPQAFDVLFTDQTMPGITGDILARAARDIRADLPVVVCTGYSEHYQVEDAARDGVRAFLTKPIDRNALRELLASLE